jgi:iron complex outermembrane recepter protein
MKRSLLFCAVLFLLCTNIVLAQEKKTIAGIVQDEKGSPLVGVSVQEKNTSNGTLTDQNGAFRLSADPEGALVFTYIGYLRQDVPLNGRVSLAIRMAQDSRGLNEVVVTAMGIKKERRKLGYAVSNVTGEEIQKASPTNFASALYGKAAGVSIQTAPGGGTSAAIIKIRGLNSINGDNQPLIVVDGVPIRNDQINNDGYYSDSRIRGNSLLDINPDNIQNVDILKGAAATALYGSSGSNGVVMITTKNGSRKAGLGVDFNYSYGMEKAAVLPEVQAEYGPGRPRKLNMSTYGTDAAGWLYNDVTGDGRPDKRPNYRAEGQFGPKFDGSDVLYWDGSTVKYVGHDDAWKKFYQTGYSSIANIALSNSNEKYNYRFSYTRNDYKGIQIGGKQEKNTFNYNTTYKVNNRLSTDLVITYVNEFVHNRPEQINRITANYGGFFSAADDMDVYLRKYQTSRGYKWVRYDETQKDPVDALKVHIRAYDFLDFLWKQKKNSYDEKSNRLISSFTLNYDFGKGVKFRGRMGNDFTGYTAETRNYAEYPIAFGESGEYGTASNQYSIAYADLLLSYNKDLSSKFSLNTSVGYQARKQDNRYNYTRTDGGLLQENWFTLNASKNALVGKDQSRRTSYLQDGLFGIVGLGYRNFLFLEGTGRYERVSTLAPGMNTYFYPSVSLSLELSRALHLPNFIDYSKLRASYGVAATPPDIYKANIVYNGASVNGTALLYPNGEYGNDALKPEFKHEYEVGWETKMYENRLGFDVSYYNNIIKNQISRLDQPTSTGARSVWQNVGDLNNYGIEAAIYATPIAKRDFEWNIRATVAHNKNKLKSLKTGLSQLQLFDLDGGSAQVIAKIGEAAGDIIVWDYKKDADGKYIINSEGLYDSDFNTRIKAGNIQPDMVGGLSNNLHYKNWNFAFLVDFRWGGQILSTTNYYMTGAGIFKSTLQYRDAGRGGLTYYEDAAGNRSLTPITGGTKYDDGMILDGVDATGKKNEKIISAQEYYFNTFTWGNYAGSGGSSTNSYKTAVYDNNFIKLREVSLNYTLPVRLANKAKVQNLTVGLFGRNLFYFYKTLPNLDPEVGIGSSFVSQGIDQGSSAASRTIGANLKLSF